MKRHQPRHLHPESIVVGGEWIVVLVQEACHYVIKLEVLYIAVRRRLKGLAVTNVRQHRFETLIKEIGIFVTIKDAVYALKALPDVGIVLLLGQDVCHHRIYVSVVPGVLRHMPTEVLYPLGIGIVVDAAKPVNDAPDSFWVLLQKVVS